MTFWVFFFFLSHFGRYSLNVSCQTLVQNLLKNEHKNVENHRFKQTAMGYCKNACLRQVPAGNRGKSGTGKFRESVSFLPRVLIRWLIWQQQLIWIWNFVFSTECQSTSFHLNCKGTENGHLWQGHA